MDKKVITVEGLTKVYPLYDRKRDRFLEAFGKTKRHKDFYALKGMDFTIGEGENVGFVGKNGSGKSTLLKILTGVLTPTAGNVQIDGNVSALLELGAGFNYEYTGIENVYLNGAIMGFSRAEMDARMDDILAFADIGDFVHQPVKMYSSGMFVRLAFAVAINVNPDILIVDEALSVGDLFFQNKCYKKFEDFRDEGKTILFVTHDLPSVIKYCDRAYLLNEGEILTEGTPKHVVDSYKKLLSGIALGEDGTATGRDGGTWRSHYTLNEQELDYGERDLEIVDFGIFNEEGGLVTACDCGETYTIALKVRANKRVEQPIFAVTVKDVKGTEVTGANTLLESVDTGTLEAGDMVTVKFTQKINLHGTQFFLSFGCTKVEMDGSVRVFHRLYDVMELPVVTDKPGTVGLVDMDCTIEVERG